MSTELMVRTPRRAKHLTPSLSEFQSLTFEEFVRYKILGSAIPTGGKNMVAKADYDYTKRDG